MLHGHRVGGPDETRRKVRECRGQPILFNENDHFDFDRDENHFLAAVVEYAGRGYFGDRFSGEGRVDGFRSVPASRRAESDRKRGFFRLPARLTGHG